MRRPRRRSRALLVVLAALALTVTACSDGGTVDTTLPPSTTAAPATTTTAPATTAAPTTTAPPTTTTTTAPPSDSVGSPQALADLIATIQQDLRFAYPDIVDAEIPIPDLTNPDPVVAVEELNKFEQWIAADYPHVDWVRVLSYPGSPSEDVGDKIYDVLYSEQRRRTRPAAPYEFLGGHVVSDLRSLNLDTSTLDGLPADAVAVLYRSSSGPLHVESAESGEVLEEFPPWEDRSNLVIVAPSATGWRVWDTIIDYAGATA